MNAGAILRGTAWLLALAASMISSSWAQSLDSEANRITAAGELVTGGRRAIERGDYATALHLFGDAAAMEPANANSALANAILGDLYENGRGVPQSDQRALDFYSKAGAEGNVKANYNLGVLADRAHDDARAVAGYRAAAEHGHAGAQGLLGQHYQYGHGVPADPVKAVEWYRKSAEGKDAFGEFGLCSAYEHGMGGLPRDIVQAAHWCQLSAEQGYALAQGNLAYLYTLGGDLPVDYALAAHWFHVAAEQDAPPAINSYAYALDNGFGVPKDIPAALKWYRRAAQYGQPNAMHSLAAHYLMGKGVTLDLSEGLYWALLADRFYSPGQKRDQVRQMLVPLESQLGGEAVQAVIARVAAFKPKTPPSPDMPTVQTASGQSLRERLRADPHFELYSVLFAVSLDADGEVLALKLVKVVDPAAGNDAAVDITPPAGYIDAARIKLSQKRPDGAPQGKASFLVYYFFSPAYPDTVISDLDKDAEHQP